MSYYFKCSECGRFCTPVDSGTMYGTYTDIDPPDEDIFCRTCNTNLINTAVKTPEKIIINCWWIKPTYISTAKAILRHYRKTKK